MNKDKSLAISEIICYNIKAIRTLVFYGSVR